ncbi:MAG: hypothetical protein ACPLY9_07220 [Nitrososphaerales archaeon]
MSAQNEDILHELVEIRKKIERIEERMVTKDEIDSLMESLEILSSNPKILKEIDKAIEQYKRGEYYTYEEVFGERV